MIKERKIEIFGYNPEEDLEKADLLFTDLNTHGVNRQYNAARIETIMRSISTELKPRAEKVVMEGFRDILLKEKTEWEVLAIQPLPGMLRIRLRHCGAWMVEDYGDEDESREMPRERRTESKRIRELFHGCEADLTLSHKAEKDGRMVQRELWFALALDTGGTGEFHVFLERTDIMFSKWLDGESAPRSSVEYELTWKNQEHTRFQAKKTREFCL